MFKTKAIKVLSFVFLLGTTTSMSALALTFEMEITAAIAIPSAPGETLSTRIVLGTDDRATDGFDTAWDVVAIQGGTIQAHIDHPGNDNATQALWRDTQASGGFPKTWNIEILPAESGISVALDWSASDLTSVSEDFGISLIDLDGNQQPLDMRSVSNYTYLHVGESKARHFQIVMEEAHTTEPAPEPESPEKETPSPEAAPQNAGSGPSIVTDLLTPGFLRNAYTARLLGQGGKGPYKWQIVSGELPAGLMLDSQSGVISGMPRRIGQYRLMVQLIDTDGIIFQKAFTLSIARRAILPRR